MGAERRERDGKSCAGQVVEGERQRKEICRSARDGYCVDLGRALGGSRRSSNDVGAAHDVLRLGGARRTTAAQGCQAGRRDRVDNGPRTLR